jgi:hypothetical protein
MSAERLLAEEEDLKTGHALRIVLAVVLLASLAPAAVIVDKSPDLGAYWQPLSGDGTYVYSNSFVFSGVSGTLVDTLGVYMQFNGGSAPAFRFELLGDNSNSPDPGTVLGVTGYQTYTGSSLQLITDTLLFPYALTNGTRYWVAASTVGQSGTGDYQVGGHTQNSIYNDNGTFWYSNNPAGTVYDGQRLTPEMAIYASGGGAAIPEPASIALIAGGLGLLGFFRRRK